MTDDVQALKDKIASLEAYIKMQDIERDIRIDEGIKEKTKESYNKGFHDGARKEADDMRYRGLSTAPFEHIKEAAKATIADVIANEISKTDGGGYVGYDRVYNFAASHVNTEAFVDPARMDKTVVITTPPLRFNIRLDYGMMEGY